MSSNNKTKIAGLILLVTIGVLIFVGFRVSSQYSATNTNEPWLYETTKSASDGIVISGSSIPMSNDGKYGIEFSYTFWMYIDGWNYPDDGTEVLKHILHKGDINGNPSQAPGIWLSRARNDVQLTVKMNTFYKSALCAGETCYLERCFIDNIPVNKWVHICVVCINNNIDLYVNGFLKKRCLLKGIPSLNYGNVYINTINNGFNGFMSKIKYFNYAIPIWKVEQILNQGPSNYIGPDIANTVPPYLSYNWWLNKFGIAHSRK